MQYYSDYGKIIIDFQCQSILATLGRTSILPKGDRKLYSDKEKKELRDGMDEILVAAIKHGDNYEFPKPVSTAFEIKALIERLDRMTPDDEQEVLLALSNFLSDLRLQLEVHFQEWEHAKWCAILCTATLVYLPEATD